MLLYIIYVTIIEIDYNTYYCTNNIHSQVKNVSIDSTWFCKESFFTIQHTAKFNRTNVYDLQDTKAILRLI